MLSKCRGHTSSGAPASRGRGRTALLLCPRSPHYPRRPVECRGGCALTSGYGSCRPGHCGGTGKRGSWRHGGEGLCGSLGAGPALPLPPLLSIFSDSPFSHFFLSPKKGCLKNVSHGACVSGTPTFGLGCPAASPLSRKQEIMDVGPGPVLVEASAGSGRTRPGGPRGRLRLNPP